MTQSPNADQADYWSTSGQSWATHQAAMDTLLSEPLKALAALSAPRPGEQVLDVGCGTGASALALSDYVGPSGRVTALDIAAPLLDMARARGQAEGRSNIDYLLADAQTHAFAPDSFDLVFSRFGVMFFDDPVAAFANLRRATRLGGRLAMLCWQGATENPWFMLPMKVAMDRLGRPEPMDPHAPGPMAFKDIDRVTGILRDAGWSAVEGQPIEVDLIPPQTLSAAADMATTIGPATRLMHEKNGTEEDLAAIQAGCAAAFAPFQAENGLRIPARLIVYSGINEG